MENSMEILEDRMSSGRFTFDLYYDGDDTYFYQCRGEMMYDDDHDETKKRRNDNNDHDDSDGDRDNNEET